MFPLFVRFRAMYGISYSLLGLLVLINFVTQLVMGTVLFSLAAGLSEVFGSPIIAALSARGPDGR